MTPKDFYDEMTHSELVHEVRMWFKYYKNSREQIIHYQKVLREQNKGIRRLHKRLNRYKSLFKEYQEKYFEKCEESSRWKEKYFCYRNGYFKVVDSKIHQFLRIEALEKENDKLKDKLRKLGEEV